MQVEARRWIIVAAMGALVAGLCTRSFWAIYLLIPLGILGAWAGVRAVARLVRAFDRKDPHDVSEAWRSALRTGAWAALIIIVVWGHGVQSARLRQDAEHFAMTVEEQRVDDEYPESAVGAPAGCSYIRGQKTRFTIVCTFTPPFEKATYTSAAKRWE